MADQTLALWRGTSKFGTLVVFSDFGWTGYLRTLGRDYSAQAFTWADEPDLVKLYVKNVAEQQLQQLDLEKFEYSWIPDTIKDIFYGKCAGDDCIKSKTCAMPGCLCHKGKCR